MWSDKKRIWWKVYVESIKLYQIKEEGILMKKVITGTLITAMISNNVAYCDIRQGELSDKN